MNNLTFEEAHRALILAISLCHRSREGLGIIIGPDDFEIVALGLFLAVLNSDHAHEVAEAVAGQG